MRTVYRSASFLALAGTALSAQANLLVNGSFETPANGNYGVYSSIPGWNAVVGQVETGRGGPNYGVTGQDGTYVCELDAYSDSTIEQTFNLAATSTLYVSFLYGQRSGITPESNAFDVILNGTVIHSFTPDSTAMQTYSFTAAGLAGTNSIRFAATGTSDSYGGIIDRVVISTPGPLAALPFALMAVKRRRRKA